MSSQYGRGGGGGAPARPRRARAPSSEQELARFFAVGRLVVHAVHLARDAACPISTG